MHNHDRALFETSSRLISHLVNEGFCHATIRTTSHFKEQQHYILNLYPNKGISERHFLTKLSIGITPTKLQLQESSHVKQVIRPSQLKPPILLQRLGMEIEELNPRVVWREVGSWVEDGDDEEEGTERMRGIGEQLGSGAGNQEAWFRIASTLPRLDFSSPAVAWERTLITGHPTHPLHKVCFAQPPLSPITPDEIPSLLSPEILFLSVPREELVITGPFETILSPLLSTLEIKPQSPNVNRIIVPSLKTQYPSILARFPSAHIIGSTQGLAQASMRTITLPPELNFPYHLKLSLACQITSALRTITPWSAIGAPAISDLLGKLLPEELWVYREVASITGAQRDFDEAKHLSCILREDLELRAEERGECLVLASGLMQRFWGEERTYAEVLFELDGERKKLGWLRSYASLLLGLVLQPLVYHGIGLEAHSQNITVRVNKSTKAITSFAVRDFGGIRLHMPTLHSQNHFLDSIPPGSAILTSNLGDVWNKVHHALVQNHLGQIVVELGLEERGGWGVVRGVLGEVLDHGRSGEVRGFYEYCLRETMTLKCCLGMMMMQGKYRDYVEREIPNVLLN